MRKPSVKEMQDAVMGQWLRLRMYARAADFRARLTTHRRECIAYDWENLALIWERYRDEARTTWQHFKCRPEVYGASTPEMIARSKALEKEYGAKAALWRAYVEWVRTHDLPREVEEYDPTTKQGELDADEPDRWAGVRLADFSARLAERRPTRTRPHESETPSRKATQESACADVLS
jgi:hypothetical protein